MAFDLLEPTLAFLSEYGLWAVFILLVLDGAMLMPVLPGEIVMIMAVAQYANDLTDLVMLVALATGAAILGSLILYGICRGGGRRLIEKHPRLFMMSPRRRKKLEGAFERPVGQSLVLFLRVIPLTRVLVNIPAGLARMKLGRFVVLSSIGMLIFHAGFMWIAFRYGDPGAGVGAQAATLSDAYASPAWDYIQANELLTGLGLLAFGALLSIRASRNMLREPDWATMSVVGWLTERILLLGGLAILAILWVDPGIVFEVAETGGQDLRELAYGFGWDPVSFVAVAAGAASILGLFLWTIGRVARARRRRYKAAEREKKRWAAEDEEEEVPVFDEVDEVDGDDR